MRYILGPCSANSKLLICIEQGGPIRGSLNLPAQSLYHSLPTLYNLCDASNINTIIWYCGRLIRLYPHLRSVDM